nr:hypothetical protein [Pseudodesulfovibrio sp.]
MKRDYQVKDTDSIIEGGSDCEGKRSNQLLDFATEWSEQPGTLLLSPDKAINNDRKQYCFRSLFITS